MREYGLRITRSETGRTFISIKTYPTAKAAAAAGARREARELAENGEVVVAEVLERDVAEWQPYSGSVGDV